MRVWTGKCRMPIGACSEFRDKECPKFCYYNTINMPNTPPDKEKANDLEFIRQGGFNNDQKES